MICVAALSFATILIFHGISIPTTLWVTLVLVGGLMLVTNGKIGWMRPALARALSTNAAPPTISGPTDMSSGTVVNSGLPTIGEGRRL